MGGFRCPRCGSWLGADAEGIIVCTECGQTVEIPMKTDRLAANTDRDRPFYIRGSVEWLEWFPIIGFGIFGVAVVLGCLIELLKGK